MTIHNLYQKCFLISDIAPAQTQEEAIELGSKYVFNETEEAGKKAEK